MRKRFVFSTLLLFLVATSAGHAQFGTTQDSGTIYTITAGSPAVAVGWIWLPDSTRDGEGEEHWILAPGYPFPSALNPFQQLGFVYQQGVEFSTLGDAVDWIVQESDQIASANQLVVHRHIVDVVQP